MSAQAKRLQATRHQPAGQAHYGIFKNFFTQRSDALSNALDHLRRTPWLSFFTILVIAIMVVLPASFYIFEKNIKQVTAKLPVNPQVSIFLKSGISAAEMNQVLSAVRDKPEVHAASLLTPEQGMDQFKQTSGLEGLLTELPDNPFPGVITLQPDMNLQNAVALAKLQQDLQAIPNIDGVQVDFIWVQRLQAILHLAKQISVGLSVLLVVAMFLIIGNTLRLVLARYKDEIAVLSLIGATACYIRRPFLYLGILYGVLGGLMAWIVLLSFLSAIGTSVGALTSLYHAQFYLQSFSSAEGLGFIAFTSALGWLAARMAIFSFRL